MIQDLGSEFHMPLVTYMSNSCGGINKLEAKRKQCSHHLRMYWCNSLEVLVWCNEKLTTYNTSSFTQSRPGQQPIPGMDTDSM
ncbi:conserved hypothetical protein [Ricinus communis]|uniref:Uncharacterized protein n=1 Tax=Ricinus communis TaxID=3988 RepID=B9R7P2_RICCO|nr:conserved hypothetical protein [Ricinus communis]